MNTEDIQKALGGLADNLGIAVKELWKVYVREYLVRGAIQLLIAGFIVFIYFALTIPLSNWDAWKNLLLIPALIYSASGLRLVLNPAYHALQNISQAVLSFKE